MVGQVLLSLLAPSLLLYIWAAYIRPVSQREAARFSQKISARSNRAVVQVLLVIAHPDDECMFFGPTLVALSKQQSVSMHLLCFTTGILSADCTLFWASVLWFRRLRRSWGDQEGRAGSERRDTWHSAETSIHQ